MIRRRALPLLAALAASPLAARAEEVAERRVESRVELAFAAPEAAVQALLPSGWQLAPVARGPSAAANLRLVLAEQVLGLDGNGRALGTGQAWDVALLVPARSPRGTPAEVLALVMTPVGNTPGPYGVAEPADVVAERVVRAAPDGSARQVEHWFARGDAGRLTLWLVADRAVPVREQVARLVVSARGDAVRRSYRGEEARDVLRGAGQPEDRVLDFVLVAEGPVLGPLFDGTERLVSVTAIPWAERSASPPPN